MHIHIALYERLYNVFHSLNSTPLAKSVGIFRWLQVMSQYIIRLQVDFLLLCGNLFHENKPSNSTLVKAIEILRRYCMNDCPVQFQVISDQAASLQNRFGNPSFSLCQLPKMILWLAVFQSNCQVVIFFRFCQVNYEDPNYKIGLPVFTIHGDQDYPTGTVWTLWIMISFPSRFSVKNR